MAEESLTRYEQRQTNRLDGKVDEIAGLVDEEDMMLALMEVLDEETIIPDVGRYYTFLYKAKTPDLLYDQHPLIACVGLFRWGFRGLNYHWGDFHNYTWEEVQGKLHVIYQNELSDARSIPYQKFLNS